MAGEVTENGKICIENEENQGEIAFVTNYF